MHERGEKIAICQRGVTFFGAPLIQAIPTVKSPHEFLVQALLFSKTYMTPSSAGRG